ncbi:MAG: hypothetical protein LBR77_05860 [Lachnospiraceae bacterium]|jgi:hypothetical protein|nr:hypothetical protein [Lachnospiraceae bacterium]
MEFVEGITVCTDCGGPLYADEETAKAALRKIAQAKSDALTGRHGPAAGGLDDDSGTDDLADAYSDDSEEGFAGDPDAFDEEDMDDVGGSAGSLDDSATGDPGAALVGRRRRGDPIPPSSVYVSSAQKHEDLKSSASAFLVVGIALVAFLALLLSGVIRLPMTGISGLIFHGALVLMALFALGTWYYCSGAARKLLPRIEEERQTTTSLIEWFVTAYSRDDIEKALGDTPANADAGVADADIADADIEDADTEDVDIEDVVTEDADIEDVVTEDVDIEDGVIEDVVTEDGGTFDESEDEVSSDDYDSDDDEDSTSDDEPEESEYDPAETARGGILALRRMEVIRDFLTTDPDAPAKDLFADQPYVDMVAEEIYNRLYEGGS